MVLTMASHIKGEPATTAMVYTKKRAILFCYNQLATAWCMLNNNCPQGLALTALL